MTAAAALLAVVAAIWMALRPGGEPGYKVCLDLPAMAASSATH